MTVEDFKDGLTQAGAIILATVLFVAAVCWLAVIAKAAIILLLE